MVLQGSIPEHQCPLRLWLVCCVYGEGQESMDLEGFSPRLELMGLQWAPMEIKMYLLRRDDMFISCTILSPPKPLVWLMGWAGCHTGSFINWGGSNIKFEPLSSNQVFFLNIF